MSRGSGEAAGTDGPLPEAYPWAREREALEALERSDLATCRERLRRLAGELRSSPDLPLPAVALLLADLLSRIRRTIGILPPASDPADRRERLRIARTLSEAAELSLLRQAFLQESDRVCAPMDEGTGPSAAVVRARAFIERNHAQRLTLAEIARAVHLSPNYLSSLFRKEAGVTVTAFLRSCRLRQAQRLLREGQHTISEVAYRVGYQSYRDFHRNFVRATGRSPRSFRRAPPPDEAGRKGE